EPLTPRCSGSPTPPTARNFYRPAAALEVMASDIDAKRRRSLRRRHLCRIVAEGGQFRDVPHRGTRQKKNSGLCDFAFRSLWTVAFQHHSSPNRLRQYDSTSLRQPASIRSPLRTHRVRWIRKLPSLGAFG